MCVIAVKPTQIELPNEESLKEMWDTNKDGAGYMYALDDKVYIEKGFMTFDELKNALELTKNKLANQNLTFRDIPMVMHFRITTHGGTSRENTHPFPITDNVDYLRALDVKAGIGVAHNGVISSVDKEETISDTMVYIRDILYPLSKLSRVFSEKYEKFIKATIGYSRLAFLRGNGQIVLIGDFKEPEEKDGLKYSNLNHIKSKPVTKYSEPYINKYNRMYDDDYCYEDGCYVKKTKLKKEDYDKKWKFKKAYYDEIERYSSYYGFDKDDILTIVEDTHFVGNSNWLRYKNQNGSIMTFDSTKLEEYIENSATTTKRGKNMQEELGVAFKNYPIYIKEKVEVVKELELIALPDNSLLTNYSYFESFAEKINTLGGVKVPEKFPTVESDGNLFLNVKNNQILYRINGSMPIRFIKTNLDTEIMIDDGMCYVYWEASSYNNDKQKVAMFKYYNVEIME